MDTGSYLSTINESELNYMSNVQIKNTTKRAKGYGNSPIEFVGEVELNLLHNGSFYSHKFLVVNDGQVSLLGRDMCEKLNFKITMSEKTVNAVHTDIFSKYRTFLSNEYKSCVSKKISLNISENIRPIFCKARSLPVRYKELVKAELSKLEKFGIITKVFSSQWACPIVNVLKSDGTIRMCGDYSMTVNKVMDVVQYPLPSIEDVIANVGDAKIFSKIDLESAYLQLPLDDASKPYTTVNTTFGLYHFNYLPFGLSSSSGIFQSFISQVLNGIENIVIYQDDILILTSDRNLHDKVLDEVLNALSKNGVKINVKKCKFYTSKVQYLGYIFDSNGVQPNMDKVKAILEAPKPTNIKQVQSFIGLCNFYNRFIRNFSEELAPLYQLLKKNTKFHWDEKQNACFNRIKSLFKSDKILKLFNKNLPTAIETDASAYGLGAVLMQKYPNGWLPVQFASRSLNDAEKNYSNIERESLAVLFGCERFKQFLLGSLFTIKSDHKPLKKLLNSHSGMPSTCSSRIQRWILRLSRFTFNFEYVKGEDNLNSDFLSRLPLKETEGTNEPYELIFVLDTLDDMPITSHDIKIHTDSSKTLCMLKNYIKYGFPNDLGDALKRFKSYENDLTLNNGCIMYHNRVYVPETLRTSVLKQLHQGHPGISGMKAIARTLVWYPGIDQDITDYVTSCKNCLAVRPLPPQNSTVEWPIPNAKWSRIHIDHFFFENIIYFIAVDARSKYIECIIVKNVSSQETIEKLRYIFSRNGLPDTIVSDNASSFTSYEFKEFLSTNGISHMTPPPYCPYSNSMAERSVRTIKELLKKNSIGNIHARLCNALLYYRNTPQSVTKISPAVALNGRNYLTVKERVNPCFIPNDIKNKIRQFNIGDRVLALNLRPGPKWYNGTITSRLGTNIYMVNIEQLDTEWKRHVQQLSALPNVGFKFDKYCTNDSIPINAGLSFENMSNPTSKRNLVSETSGSSSMVETTSCVPKSSGIAETTSDVVETTSDVLESSVPLDLSKSGQQIIETSRSDLKNNSNTSNEKPSNFDTETTSSTDLVRRSMRTKKPTERFIAKS